jgi:hypothetical protein
MLTNPPSPAFGLNPPPVSPSATPPAQPVLYYCWEATAILHPFSPPPTSEQDPSPFFELCIANIAFVENQYLSVQLLGASRRTWWYYISKAGTQLSTDQGQSFQFIETGWTVPPANWVAKGRYFATGPLNWMEGAPSVDWWTQPVANSNAATWIWYDSTTQMPVRMMFGAPPPSSGTGFADQLGFFQNFSFTYFPTFAPRQEPGVPPWSMPDIPTFKFGNSSNLQLFVWSSNFGMSPMMTPVNAASNPLPTQVHYHWTRDANYQQLTDRAQVTQMSYVFNSQAPPDPQTDTVVMYGGAPAGMTNPPPFAGQWVDYTTNNAGFFGCTVNPGAMVLGAEAPDWVSTPGEQGMIWATISNDPVVSPNNGVAIYSVLFPPSNQYPNGRFLWTWYSPFDGTNGARARPVVFMESASSISEGGTSLALADYYDYQEFTDPIPPETFLIPLPPGFPTEGSSSPAELAKADPVGGMAEEPVEIIEDRLPETV